MDMFPQTTKQRKRLWICSLARKNSKDIQPIVSSHAETVVLLSQRKPDDIVQVELNAEDLALTSAETKATYVKIKTYVKRAFGFKVSSLYIAQVKQKMGLPMGKNYNVRKKGTRVPLCPPEKEEAILEALRHYKMI